MKRRNSTAKSICTKQGVKREACVLILFSPLSLPCNYQRTHIHTQLVRLDGCELGFMNDICLCVFGEAFGVPPLLKECIWFGCSLLQTRASAAKPSSVTYGLDVRSSSGNSGHVR